MEQSKIIDTLETYHEPQVILWEGPAIVNLKANAGLIIQAEAAYYITTRVGNHRNVRRIDTVASHTW